MLQDDGEQININTALLNSLTKACRLKNDKVQTRLPICKTVLYLILKEIPRLFQTLPYLEKLYAVLFTTAYFGLFRIGELTHSEHVLRVVDVKICKHGKKFMFVLHTSKTHGLGEKPQIIKMSAVQNTSQQFNSQKATLRLCDSICPFSILRMYLAVRKSRWTDVEQFFVHKDRSPVTSSDKHCPNVYLLQV